jgi:hypothetical protein
MVPTHPPATRQPELLARLAISVFINSFQDRLVGHQLDKVATWAKAGNIVSLNRSMLSIRTALRRYLSVLMRDASRQGRFTWFQAVPKLAIAVA